MSQVTALVAFAVAVSIPVAGCAERPANPLRFFEGFTESVATVKIFAKKPFRSKSFGRGEMKPDGSLQLVQRVEEEGKPAHERRWLIRQIAPGRYSGTMSEATGLVSVEEIGGRYLFRFKIKGDLSVEQWLIPLPGGASALNLTTIRKFGMRLASAEGTIRKLN